MWRMMPECKRNTQNPDVEFLFADAPGPLKIECNDGRSIEVQGTSTSNASIFVSSLNISSITSLQLYIECLYDDGINVASIGNDTVFTTGKYFFN